MMDTESPIVAESTPVDGPLVLPNSGLRLENGCLTKTAKTGETLARHTLAELTDVHLTRGVEPMGFVLAAISLGLAVVFKAFLDSTFWSWLLAVLFAGGFAACLVTVHKLQIVVVSRHGKARYDNADLNEEAEGFVLSVRERLHAISPIQATEKRNSKTEN